jgi:protein-disulfide isomerase
VNKFQSSALALLLAAGALTLAAQTPDGPAAATPAPTAAPLFPPPNPAFFTATTPTVDTVNAFLKSLWGYDPNRVWSVAAILKTKAPGVAKIVVFVGDKTQASKTQQTVFFTTPDGNHAIADNVIDFGPKPFDANRKVLQERADGPFRNAASKQLEIVEFSDLQCPHCRDAQATMDQLAADFPQARVVFQNFPLSEIHPFAFEAAAEGLCVRKSLGDAAFFKYAQNVFDTQEGLTAEGSARTLANAASKAGADPAVIATCAKTPAITDNLKASVQLAKDLGVDSTPMIFINGFGLPLNGVPYEALKRIVVYRANEDGMNLTVQPSLKTLK